MGVSRSSSEMHKQQTSKSLQEIRQRIQKVSSQGDSSQKELATAIEQLADVVQQQEEYVTSQNR